MDNLNKPSRKHYDSSSKSGTDINYEVQKLFRKGTSNNINETLFNLRGKFDQKTYDDIFKIFHERHSLISKKSKKFTKLIRERYGLNNLPFHTLINKAKLFKDKYNLSDEEFLEFQRLYESELIGINSDEVIMVKNNMSQLLGSYLVQSTTGFTQYKLNDTDYKYLQEILKLFSSTSQLYSQVLFQSLQYTDCDKTAVTGEFKREFGHRPTDCIHPIIAALFLPKVPLLERHFLHSNIARIIKCKYNNEPIKNRPDHELLYALTTDPNDIICDNRSVILDILNRAQIQVQLWNCVLNLRNGQYYNPSFKEFITSIDSCRINRQDTPDFIYGKYDGTILKRLFSAFSFRPTIVSSQSITPTIYVNPYQQTMRPTVSYIPMINFRLPPSSNDDDTEINLNDALKQEQFVLHNNVVIPKSTNILYSSDVIFFYVDRKTNTFSQNDFKPFNFVNLPLVTSGMERLNTKRINFDDSITVGDCTYLIRSVVVAEVGKNFSPHNIIIGSSAFVIYRPIELSPKYSMEDYEAIMYNPVDIKFFSEKEQKYIDRPPIFGVQYDDGLGDDAANFKEVASQRGIIFMYTKHKISVENEENQ